MTGLRCRSARRAGAEDGGSRSWRGLLYIAPAMALVIVFFVCRCSSPVWMSLHNWPLLGVPRWIGLGNYTRMLNDSRFLAALSFTPTTQ